MRRPKRIEDIDLDDLRRHRWCYFHDDDNGFDSFEWVIPDTHPNFSSDVMELELATFRFQDGQAFPGMFDGAAQFSVCLAGEWYALWAGVATPTEQERARLADALSRLGLALPVEATARWSGKRDRYHGIRYVDPQRGEMEI